MTIVSTARRAVGFSEFAQMFGISRDAAKRLAQKGELRTIYIGGRRLIPMGEVERAERDGVGSGRKKRTVRPDWDKR